MHLKTVSAQELAAGGDTVYGKIKKDFCWQRIVCFTVTYAGVDARL